MGNTGLKAHIAERLTTARDLYVKDLVAIDEPNLGQSLGGTARTPYDFTYEVIFVNGRIATRMGGNTPEPFDGDGWMVAPEEFRSKAALIKGLEESCARVLDVWNSIPDEKLETEIETPTGPTSALKLASLCATHLSYHDAQLNYIQSLLGDDEMHWG